ncbi:MAG: hypothetical protein ACX94D_01060 [Henriciella sp.]
MFFRTILFTALVTGLAFSGSGKANACVRKDIKPMSFDGAIEKVNCPRGVACSGKISKAFNVPNIDGDGYSVRRLTRTSAPLCLWNAVREAEDRVPRKYRKADRQTRERLQAIIEEQGLTTPFEKLYSEIMANDRLRLLGLEDDQGNRLLPAHFRWIEPLSDRYVWVWDLDWRARLIDLKTGENKPFADYDRYGFSGSMLRFNVGPNRTALNVFAMNKREDRYDLAIMGPDGKTDTIVPDLRGTWDNRDKVDNRSILALNGGVLLFFGLDGNNEPITYRFKRGEGLSAMPGGLNYVPIMNLQANKFDDHGYLLLRPAGLLQTDIGTGSRVYYESYNPITLELQKLDDPNYLGVIPVLPSKQERVYGDKDSIYYRQVLFVYRKDNSSGAAQSQNPYEFQIVNGASGPQGDNGKINPNSINIFKAAPDYEKLAGVWLPPQPSNTNRASVQQAGTGIWTATSSSPTIRYDIKELKVRPEASGPTRLAANQAAIRADQARRDRVRQQIAQSEQWAADDYLRRQADRQRREEQWARQEEERRRRNAGTPPSVWQSVSPFRADGTYKRCYYDSDRKYDCY